VGGAVCGVHRPVHLIKPSGTVKLRPPERA
jgi:hypothetical protein